MYEDINLFINCMSGIFIIFGVWNILNIRHQLTGNGIMIAVGMVSTTKKLDEIEKTIGLPPSYDQVESNKNFDIDGLD